jgi:glycosyltransferase involved in cell wall biosynthesis
MSDHIRILAIVPAFNEEQSILTVVSEIRNADSRIDVLVVNDKSTDSTESVLLENGINHLSLPLNLGIGGAVQSGFKFAKKYDYDYAIQIDGDGQHPAEQIDLLLNPIVNDQADFVVGSRYINGDQIVSSIARRWGGGLISFLLWFFTRTKVSDPTSGFRVYNKKAIAYLSDSYPQEYPEPISALELLEHGFRYKEVPVKMRHRQFGKSSITGLRTVFYMIKVMFAILIAKLRRGGYICQT